ncbi:MAG: Asp-tRNA(Asn)/Glu-tRNA(Gln) amidotransferase subunit GatB [Candidatus Omnitrophica bacterium]|nr:Asp-tRNA(Asn)/Glu-tRNA(Gln) amidotransferase subunit GatB [Candidatus Omnitrophota bacterium]
MDFETVIGLEVHLQLNTATKIFCGCRNVFGVEANTCVCPVCLGLPGSLPVLNRDVLFSGIKVGLALNCSINTFVKFDRKNYYYPDLPKGYQISQYDFPIAKAGFLPVMTGGQEKRIGITRAHLEEDAGKLIHDDAINATLVDYNRTGTPLVEIVSEPDMRSADEAYDYLTTLKLALQYLNVSDCDMEKGSLRCDANVSIRSRGETKLGTKTELKNMNSFSAVKRAIDFEVARQTRLVIAGESIVQQTLLWNEEKGITIPMRSKEQAHDYRYFPEPDLVPFTLTEAEIDKVRCGLPELPYARLHRLIEKLGVSEYDGTIIVQDKTFADFFESALALGVDVKKLCNWMNGPLMKELNDRKCRLGDLKLTPGMLVELINKVEDGTVSNLAGKEILAEVVATGRKIEDIIKEKGLTQVSDEALIGKIVDEIILKNPQVVEQVRSGKANAAGFLVGQAMKQMQGKANPKIINEFIQRRITNV